MAYKIKSYGKKFGGSGIRSGYIKPSWDPMPPYRQPSAPETEYSRKLRASLAGSEVKGPSTFSSDVPRYRTNQEIHNLETTLSRSEVSTLIQNSLRNALKNFVEVTGKKPVPDEVFHVAFETAQDVAKGLQRNPEKTETVEEKQVPPDLNIDQLNEIRQQEVNEKRKEMDEAKTLDEVGRISSEIQEINGKFFDQLDSHQSETGVEKAINETNPLLDGSGLKPTQVDEAPEFLPQTELVPDLNYQKKKYLDYDSEIGY